MRSRHNVLTLIIFPLLFTALTFTIIHFLILPIIRPYVELAGLFVSSTSQAHVPKDLLSAIKSPPADDTAGSGEENTHTAPDASDTDMIALSSITMPRAGDLYGWLTIEGTVINAPVYWDDSPRELNAGVGTYAGAWLPGFGRTIMLAGHRNSWLADLKSAEIGAVITVETHYGTYTYEITEIAVYHMNDPSSYDFDRKDENIIIYTCYPFDFIGLARERYFVYGIPLTGLMVDTAS